MLSSHDWMRHKRIHENLEQVQHTTWKHLSYCLRPLFVQKYSINRFFPLSSLFFSSISSEIVGNSGGKIHLWPNFSFEEYILIYVWKIKISRCIIRPRMKRGEMLFLVPVIFPNGTFFVVQHPTTDCVFLFMPVFFSPQTRGSMQK